MRRLLGFLCALVLLLSYVQAEAQLKDFGAVSTVNGFPLWYRDTNNVPLEPCLSAAQSSNLLNPGPMCITDAGAVQGPFNPLLPVTFPVNFPTNPIYFDATAQIPDAATPAAVINVQFNASLEGGFGPLGAGLPAAGTQTTFMVINIQFDATVPGTYTIVHPYGTQTIPVAIPGPQVFQQYYPAAPVVGNFAGSLAGPVGPFLQWTPTLPSPIGTEQFIGDPNIPHAVTGSPTGNNFLRVTGPVGSNLDGLGGTTVTTSLFNISGKMAAVPVAISSLTAAPTSPQSIGASVTFTAAAAGGTGALEYQFTLKSGATSTVVQAYSAVTSWTWNTATAAAGSYTVQVDVRQKGTTTAAATQSIPYTLTTPTVQPISITSFAVNPASAQTVGSSIVFNAAAGGGSGSFEYQYTLISGASSTVVRPYATAGAWTWNTAGAAAGNYTIQVDVRQAGATQSAASRTLPYILNSPTSPVTITTLTANPASPQLQGTAVTFTTSGTGGSGTLEYRFALDTGTSNTVVQPYSAATSWTWSTGGVPAGTYTIQVDARVAGSTLETAATRRLSYTINALPAPPPVTVSSLSANPVSPQNAGTPVTFTAAATGGSGALQYRFTLTSGASSTVVKDYSAGNSWSWNTSGAAPGNYNVQVDVRQSGAAQPAVSQTISYTLATAPQPTPVVLSSFTATPPSPQGAGTPVVVTAAATGGSGAYEFQFSIGDGTTTSVSQAYSANSTFTWNTAGTSGTFVIQVEVRETGAVASSAAQTLTYTLTTQQPTTGNPTTITHPLFTQPILDGQAQFKAIGFKSPLPFALDPSFVYKPDKTREPGIDWYTIVMRETFQSGGLVDDSSPNLTPLPPYHAWAYGDPAVGVSYPGRTFEARTGTPIKVQWQNALPPTHILPVDRTLMCGPNLTTADTANCPDNRTSVHVHGSHGYDHSDGLPEQWFSPNYALVGTQWQANTEFGPAGTNFYPVDQDAATLWYHDHATGITRLNAYAGLAGFFLVRDANELAMLNANPPALPTAPYELPIAFQDKAFWGATVSDPTAYGYPYIVLGSWAYPDTPLQCDQTTGTCSGPVLVNGQPTPTIPTEMFGNIMLANGIAWPNQDVEQRRYRLRLLNGCDARTLILQLATPGVPGVSMPVPTGDPIIVIGTEQGFLDNPVNVQQLVIQPGMRFDVVIDFGNKPVGTRLVLQNIGPDIPYNGTLPAVFDVNGNQIPFGTLPMYDSTGTQIPYPYPKPAFQQSAYIPTDPDSTGVTVQFTIATPADINVQPDAILPPDNPQFRSLRPTPLPALPAVTPKAAKKVFLKEVYDNFGRVKLSMSFKGYFDPITELMPLGTKEVWEIANLTPDAHPMHLHLVKFRVLERENIAILNGQPYPATPLPVELPQPAYTWVGDGKPLKPQPGSLDYGYLDTVTVKPGTLTRIQATFDIPGIYVWHCHILSHEEYDMMRQFAVTTPAKGLTVTSTYGGTTVTIPAPGDTPPAITFTANAQTGLSALPGTSVKAPATTMAYEYQFTVKSPTGVTQMVRPWSTANTLTIGGTTGQFPNVPGTWLLQVDARALGAAARQASKVVSLTAKNNVPVGMTLTGPAATTQNLGDQIPVTYTATGLSALPSTPGPGAYEYQFSIRLNNGQTQVVQPYLDTASGSRNPGTWTWTPAADQAPGLYYVQADIRTAGSTSPRMFSKTLTYRITAPKPVGVTLAADSTQRPAATASPVTFTAAGLSALPGTVGPGPYEYQFWLKNASGKLQLVQSWSQNPVWVWTPPNIPGQYSVEVDARAVGGVVKDAVKTIGYTLR